MERIELADKLVSELIKQHKTVSTAESVTGGMVASSFVDIPAVSEVFPGGIVSYAYSAKSGLLGVDPDRLERDGAVNEYTVKTMVLGTMKKFDTNCAIATTGAAGPTTRNNVPIGTVYIAVANREKGRSANDADLKFQKLFFEGERNTIRENATKKALEMLYDFIRK